MLRSVSAHARRGLVRAVSAPLRSIAPLHPITALSALHCLALPSTAARLALEPLGGRAASMYRPYSSSGDPKHEDKQNKKKRPDLDDMLIATIDQMLGAAQIYWADLFLIAEGMKKINPDSVLAERVRLAAELGRQRFPKNTKVNEAQVNTYVEAYRRLWWLERMYQARDKMVSALRALFFLLTLYLMLVFFTATIRQKAPPRTDGAPAPAAARVQRTVAPLDHDDADDDDVFDHVFRESRRRAREVPERRRARSAYDGDDARRPISMSQFLDDVAGGAKVGYVQVRGNHTAYVYAEPPSSAPGAAANRAQPMYTFTIGSAQSFERQLREAEEDAGIAVGDRVPVDYDNRDTYSFAQGLLAVGPTLLIVAFLAYSMRGLSRQAGGRGGGSGSQSPFNFGKSKASMFKQENAAGVRFDDVAGLPEAKQEVMEFVDFLKNPERYRRLGATIPRGALLVGPPGTGKTLLAKAAAGEAGVPFFVTSGSEFLEMFVGVGPARVRDLFAQARKHAPSMVFIDEVDAIGRSRSQGRGGSNDERESTLNALLVEMDGFRDDGEENVVVLAGTNRVDMLDKALLRPGRFDRQIDIDLPDRTSRVEIFKVHLRKLKLLADEVIDLPATPPPSGAPGDKDAPSVAKQEAASGAREPSAEKLALIDSFAERLSKLTPSFSGADIANVCNEAALIAARRRAPCVTMSELDAAIERVIGGLEKKDKVITAEERAIVAHYEAGKAVVSWFLEHCEPLLKVSIVPRGSQATGYAQYESSDQYLHTEEQMFDRMCQALGGRAAEQLHFGTTTTASEGDLQRVTRMAYYQMSVYGMSKELGNVSFQQTGGGAWGTDGFTQVYSDTTARLMDVAVRDLVQRAFDHTCELLRDQRTNVETVARVLLEKETIARDDLVKLLGKAAGAATEPAATS